MTDALTRMIARLSSQRACLDHAASLLRWVEGPVFEIGLGKARTYDRLRAIFPDRTIVAFDRELHCPEALRPPPALLRLGDFRDTLKAALAEFEAQVVFAHADFGSHDRERDRELARAIAPLIARLMRPGGIVASDRALDGQGLEELPLPPASGDWPYFLYRR